ncbi:hypothetical protein [Hyphococcus sp.]|jgi:hypothetical protein|uniref:hypothetical protein n=1 Tax=Hyphococcus sp. TaxID=2038636 RepID=UPI003D148495
MKFALIAGALALASTGAAAAPAKQQPEQTKAAPKHGPIIMHPVTLYNASTMTIITKADMDRNSRNRVQITMTSK